MNAPDSNSDHSQALQHGARLEEFIIERVLGSGGFGITYLARDTSLGRKVVIKENLPSQFAWRETATGTVRPRHTTGGDVDDFEWSMKNFLRESGTLASLDHPGIVRVLRQFSANGTAYFVMPFVEGVPFDGLIEDRKAKNSPFSEQELHGLIDRMLAALGYLHDRGIYHRDIKPANILITNDGIPVLIDFGSARQSSGERSMTVIESAGYTPFEQLQSRGNIGPWSDLYAFGATLAKAITFETPPKAADRMMGDPWPGLVGDSRCTSFSDWFLQAIDRSMAVDPRQRWQNAAEWREFLNGGASSNAPSVSQHSSPPVPTHAQQPATTVPLNASQPKMSGTNRRHPERGSRFWKSWPLRATTASLCILFVGALIRPETAFERMADSNRGVAGIFGEGLGMVFGAGFIALVVALVVAAFLAALKKPFLGSLSRGYSLGIVIISVLVFLGNSVSRSYRPSAGDIYSKAEEQSAKKTLSGLEDDIQKVFAEGTGPDGLPKETDFRFEKKSSPTDDMERMRELIRSFFNDMIALQNDYLAALDKDGINTLLDANRVAKDPNFRESRSILARVRITVQRFRIKASSILADFPKRLNDNLLDEKSNDAMMSGYREGVGKSLPRLKETWDLEVAVIDHMDDLIDHLEATRSHWIPEDGMFTFERDGDLNKFNAIMAKITACVEKQTEIKESAQKSATEKIGSMKARIPE
jgi:serine/threonine protein kinase